MAVFWGWEQFDNSQRVFFGAGVFCSLGSFFFCGQKSRWRFFYRAKKEVKGCLGWGPNQVEGGLNERFRKRPEVTRDP